MRCIAVDDEPFALKLIADDIRKVPFLELVKTFSSGLEAIEYLKKESVDLLFLDIQMPVLKGTELIRILQNPPLVVFTTAYEQYALEGFELNVIDYLVKPVIFERFLKAANKAQEQFVLRKTAGSPKSAGGYFFVHSEYKEIKIFFDDILYVEGLKDYVKIFLSTQQRPVLTRLNLKAIEAKLPGDKFCRIHNSYIVSLARISSIQKSQVFIGSNTIPVGDKFADDFRTRYKLA
jgi:DNA-binding LytR/AlgR family response regulator